MSDPLPADLALALQTSRPRRGHLGEPATFFLETTSTNDVAAALAERGAPEGSMVIAAAQTSGRGRMGRTWHSPPGAGLYFSIVFRSPSAAPFLTLLGGVAVADGIRAATGLPLEIKWPNDVVTAAGQGPARRRKVAGILAEGSSSNRLLHFVVLGIGINLRAAAYPPALADRASSIEVELGRPVETGAVLAEILATLAEALPALTRGDGRTLLARWRALAPSAHGAVVECETGGGRVEGIASGIADDGALLVRVGGTVERIVAGEVVWK
jgi:BirA family transcriptional regulator, biotin operon repressor / biotin---[acetyl-CoA-carboxylase] ligase